MINAAFAVLAFSAISGAILGYEGVGGVVGVPMRAVRASFESLSHHKAAVSSTKPASFILSLRDRLKMLRVDAGPDAAKVVNVKTFRDGSDQQFVGQTVSSSHLGRKPFAELELSVSSAVGRSKPQPAAAIRLGRDKIHEAFDNGLSHVTPFKSHRSGSLGADNTVVGRSYFSAQVAA